MRLRPEQLDAHLKKQLLPVYLVSGEEELVVQEACDAIRARARAEGCEDREVLHAEGKFDWGLLNASAAEMSLFASRKLIELRLPSGKPGTEGSKALTEYLDGPRGDDILLIIAGKIDRQSTNSKWFKALDGAGAVLQVWPVDARELPRWLASRLQRVGLQADNDALQLLGERVQGNLLAAAQEVEKLRLLVSGDRITAADITGAVTDNARYDLFAMVDHALLGKAADALKMLGGLRAEGTEAAVVVWALAKEIRLLYQCRRAVDQGNHTGQAMKAQRVWDRRQPVVGAALERHDGNSLSQLLGDAAETDRCIKGLGVEDPWDRLSQLLLDLSGPR